MIGEVASVGIRPIMLISCLLTFVDLPWGTARSPSVSVERKGPALLDGNSSVRAGVYMLECPAFK